MSGWLSRRVELIAGLAITFLVLVMCGFFVFVWVIAGPRSSTPASADDQALSVPAVTLSVEGYYDGGKHKTSMWEFRWKGHDFITHPDGRWIIHSPACGCGWMPKAEKQR